MPEELQLRIHGDASLPTLIYFPGLHGDWTLVGGFRKELAGKVRFVELAYPRTLTWSLDDYAAASDAALAQAGITTGWLLGESYGSQVLWSLVARKRFTAQGIVLAGGFVKHPMPWGVRLVRTTIAKTPFKVLGWLLSGYAAFARIRFRRSPETLANFHEFVTRRTELDVQAAIHRLDQIAGFDPREIARTTNLPIFYLSGWLDPIVPWPLTRHWLRKNCPSLRADKIIFPADHNILGTAPAQAASQTLTWMLQKDIYLQANDPILFSIQ
jgi:pimeloyl-ACP methyl ester carboxylesterase